MCVSKVEHYNIVWRLSFALSLVSPISIFWFRIRMAVSTAYPEEAAHTMLAGFETILQGFDWMLSDVVPL